MIRAIIIDDEQLARDQVVAMLKTVEDIEIVDQCSNGLEGYHAIQKHTPDLVFLDIQMPKVNGFEMLELLDDMPVVIFSTAYDQYALKAFEVHAVDYLLKPYSLARFKEALDIARERIPLRGSQNPERAVQESYDEQSQQLNRVVIKQSGKINIIPTRDISHLEAMGDYVAIHCDAGKLLKLRTMKYFEDHLDPEKFVRVHRSAIVNLDFVDRMEPYSKDSMVVIMQNKERVFVSRSGMKKLKEMMDFKA